MVGKIIQLYNPAAEVDGSHFTFTAAISAFNSASQVTIDRVSPRTVGGLLLWVYGPKMTVTGLSVVGDNIFIKRVRVINFGTRTPSTYDGQKQPDPPSPNRTIEGFPFIIQGRTADTPSFNSRVEDCIFEQPNPWPAREVTSCLITSGILPINDASKKLHLQPFGSVVRNCYFNFDFVNELNRWQRLGVV